MKKRIGNLLTAILLALLVGLNFSPVLNVSAEGEGEETPGVGTSISLTPVSKILQISSEKTYDDTFSVNNDGADPIKIEVYAAPYSYVYSNEEDLYKLGFTNENNYTQISRWITFKDNNGNYTAKPVFQIEPGKSIDISFRITTPSNIPSGGQYAVIFAHTLSSANSGSGIRTEASPGMIVYGRSTEGESTVSAEFSDLKISEEEGKVTGSVKVKNDGNVDFNAKGVLRVEPIIGFSSYGTDKEDGSVHSDSDSGTKTERPETRISVIPETELALTHTWENTPSFGIYKATFTVSVGEKTETVEKIIVRMPLFVIVIIIILLTFLTIWIILMVRKRKERRSRLAV